MLNLLAFFYILQTTTLFSLGIKWSQTRLFSTSVEQSPQPSMHMNTHTWLVASFPKNHHTTITISTLQYRSNITSHSLASIFLESRYSILFSRQILAQILRESSEGSRLMLRTRLVELDHLSEFALSLEWLTRVVYCCWITRSSYSRDIKSLIRILLEL